MSQAGGTTERDLHTIHGESLGWARAPDLM